MERPPTVTAGAKYSANSRSRVRGGGDLLRRRPENAAARVKEAITGSRLVVLPHQQHVAMDSAPELLLHEVLELLA